MAKGTEGGKGDKFKFSKVQANKRKFVYETTEKGSEIAPKPSWCQLYPNHPRCMEVQKPRTPNREPEQIDFSSDSYCRENPNDSQCQKYNAPFQEGLGVAGVPTDLTTYGKNREIWNNEYSTQTLENDIPDVYDNQPQYRKPEFYENPPLTQQQGTSEFGMANLSANCNTPTPPTYTTAQGGTLNQVVREKKNTNMFQGKSLYGDDLDIYKRSFYNPLDFVI